MGPQRVNASVPGGHRRKSDFIVPVQSQRAPAMMKKQFISVDQNVVKPRVQIRAVKCEFL